MSRAARGGRNHAAGLLAEEAAARAYEAAGAELLARRWRCPAGEIDLVLREAGCLVFAEVKRRKGPVEDDPVGPKGWIRLEMAAETYMIGHGSGDGSLRFDLVLVGADGRAEIIRNART